MSEGENWYVVARRKEDSHFRYVHGQEFKQGTSLDTLGNLYVPKRVIRKKVFGKGKFHYAIVDEDRVDLGQQPRSPFDFRCSMEHANMMVDILKENDYQAVIIDGDMGSYVSATQLMTESMNRETSLEDQEQRLEDHVRAQSLNDNSRLPRPR